MYKYAMARVDLTNDYEMGMGFDLTIVESPTLINRSWIVNGQEAGGVNSSMLSLFDQDTRDRVSGLLEEHTEDEFHADIVSIAMIPADAQYMVLGDEVDEDGGYTPIVLFFPDREKLEAYLIETRDLSPDWFKEERGWYDDPLEEFVEGGYPSDGDCQQVVWVISDASTISASAEEKEDEDNDY